MGVPIIKPVASDLLLCPHWVVGSAMLFCPGARTVEPGSAGQATEQNINYLKANSLKICMSGNGQSESTATE